MSGHLKVILIFIMMAEVFEHHLVHLFRQALSSCTLISITVTSWIDESQFTELQQPHPNLLVHYNNTFMKIRLL